MWYRGEEVVGCDDVCVLQESPDESGIMEGSRQLLIDENHVVFGRRARGACQPGGKPVTSSGAGSTF